MHHRHLDSDRRGPAEIDSVLDRGTLEDWRALFADAKEDSALRDRILKVAASRPADGYSVLAMDLIEALRALAIGGVGRTEHDGR